MGDVPRKHWNQKCNMQLIGSSQGFAAMQVDSSDEEFDALLATLGESRENQRLAWSQVASALTPKTADVDAPISCSQAVVVASSQDEEDSSNTGAQRASTPVAATPVEAHAKRAFDLKRGLCAYLSSRSASSQAGSPLKRAHTAIETWRYSSLVLSECRRLLWQPCAVASLVQGKTVRVLLPCGGVDAPGWAAKALGIKFDVVGFYGTDPHYAAYMTNVGVEPSRVHVGRELGDFNRLALSQVPECNLLVAGPPCPPFSHAGKRNMFEDERSHVFFHIIAVIGHCAATQPGFSCFVLENVAGMLDVPGGKKNNPYERWPIDHVVDELFMLLGRSEWLVRVHKLDAKDFGLPQSRPRVYIAGTRLRATTTATTAILPEHLRAVASHGQAAASHGRSAGSSADDAEASSHDGPAYLPRRAPTLADLMDKSLPSASRHDGTELQRKTIQDNKDALRVAMCDTNNMGAGGFVPSF